MHIEIIMTPRIIILEEINTLVKELLKDLMMDLDGFIEIPIQDTPKIRAMFEIFEPTTVPIASSSLLLITDDMPTKISGADVPRATIVKPIASSLIPSFFARSEELSTNLSAPQTNTAIDSKRAVK